MTPHTSVHQIPLFYREIELTQGQTAIVDPEDYDRLMAMGKWFAAYDPTIHGFYARRNGKYRNGKRLPQVSMHRAVLNLTEDDDALVDHRNPALTLDNRKSNLRLANDYEQAFNRQRRRDNTSGHKGVSRYSEDKWISRIMAHGKRITLCVSSDKEVAAEAYRVASAELHKEFARSG